MEREIGLLEGNFTICWESRISVGHSRGLRLELAAADYGLVCVKPLSSDHSRRSGSRSYYRLIKAVWLHKMRDAAVLRDGEQPTVSTVGFRGGGSWLDNNICLSGFGIHDLAHLRASNGLNYPNRVLKLCFNDQLLASGALNNRLPVEEGKSLRDLLAANDFTEIADQFRSRVVNIPYLRCSDGRSRYAA